MERARTAHKAGASISYDNLGVVANIPYTDATAYEHARIWAFLEASGTMIGFYDLMVAATAVELEGRWRPLTEVTLAKVVE